MINKSQQKKAITVIYELRKKRLKEGKAFMINSNLLPSHQCYLEFPDGTIVIAKANSKESDFKIVEELDGFEINNLRKNLKLY